MNLKNTFKNTFIFDIYLNRKLNCFRKKMARKFPENDIKPMNIFPIDCVSIGNHTYGELNVITFNDCTKLHLGNFVSIAQHVTFLLDTEHNYDTLTTFPHKVKTLNSQVYEAYSKGDIFINDEVWIGYGATILSGVTIGQGAIVGAGALVTKNVPPYSIVGGVPARVIKYRFDNDLVSKLNEIDFSCIDDSMIRNHITDLYEKIDAETDISWMPKKLNK